MASVRIIAVIPARYRSSRFPGKPIHPILGKPMLHWVVERVQQASLPECVLVATDDERIAEVARAIPVEVVMTDSRHPSGTDRVAEAVASIDCEIVVNVQGDEPLISPKAVDQVVAPLLNDPALPMATLCRRAKSREEVHNPNTARVVLGHNRRALYFSRAPIPFDRDGTAGEQDYLQHVGIYAYRKDFLLTFSQLPPSPLEKIEKLEQLRAVENGYPIYVAETEYAPICVDVPDDVLKVEQELRKVGFVQ